MPVASNPCYKGILFDLDGTLVDTAPDMASALNRLLVKHKRAVLPFESIRPVVSHGGAALVSLGFADVQDEQILESLRQEYLEEYQNNLVINTVLFDGIKEVLLWIKEKQLKWGIVTNKPQWLTEPLLQQLSLPIAYDTLICGDTLSERKPHPLPMYTACEEITLEPKECIYLGDAQRDIEAANNAGMPSIIANYGYIDEQDNPSSWNATHSINHASESIKIFLGQS